MEQPGRTGRRALGIRAEADHQVVGLLGGGVLVLQVHLHAPQPTHCCVVADAIPVGRQEARQALTGTGAQSTAG